MSTVRKQIAHRKRGIELGSFATLASRTRAIIARRISNNLRPPDAAELEDGNIGEWRGPRFCLFAPALFPGRFLLSSSHVSRRHLSRQTCATRPTVTCNEIDSVPVTPKREIKEILDARCENETLAKMTSREERSKRSKKRRNVNSRDSRCICKTYASVGADKIDTQRHHLRRVFRLRIKKQLT